MSDCFKAAFCCFIVLRRSFKLASGFFTRADFGLFSALARFMAANFDGGAARGLLPPFSCLPLAACEFGLTSSLVEIDFKVGEVPLF